ncbi:lipoprotein [Nocardioides alkalitolerans]|uniref:LptM family lipoprotein n=1 Tax=Nocardioides alkalitolerans TaxID=281714 RepID=UPI000413FF5D|nr:hypothetical protein [Nocardioides alkalitolerans]
MKRVLSVAALVLAAGSLSACGGGPGADAPTDASVDDFCAAFAGIVDYLDEDGETFQAADYADKLAEVGTPEDISDEARSGFELYVEAFEDLGNDASEDEVDDAEVEDNGDTDAFDDYAAEACA